MLPVGMKKFQKWLRDQERSQRTIDIYVNAAMDCATWHGSDSEHYPLEALTTKQIDEYLTYLKDDENLMQATRRKRYAGVSQYLQFLHNTLEKTDEVPEKSIQIEKTLEERQQETKYLTKADDVKKIREYIYTKETNTRHRRKLKMRDIAIVETLVHTGCRASELMTIDFREIEWDTPEKRTGMVKIWNGKTSGRKSKADHYRYVWVPESVVQSWVNYFGEARYDGPKRIFASLTYTAIYYIVSEIGKAIGLEWLTPHQFRHYFATHMVREGIELSVVANAMGDTPTTVRDTYLHLDSVHAANIFREKKVSI